MSENKAKYPRFQDATANNIPSKRKKNAPDRPQPAWLFPPDKENPILNPKPKSDEKLQKEAVEREQSLDYMKRRVHSVPDRPAPPPQLLTLVGAFLTEFGFSSTSRLFTNERKARKTLNGWEDAIDQKLETGVPSLETIYRDFYRKRQTAKAEETSSSSSSDEDSEVTSKASDSGESAAEDGTDSEAESASDSDLSKTRSKSAISKKGPPPSTSPSSVDDSKEEVPLKANSRISNKERKSTQSSSSSSSDSDADDEKEPAGPKTKVEQASARVINKLKRKASSSSSNTSESSDSSENEQPPPKKTKTTTLTTTATNILPRDERSKSIGKVSNDSASSSPSSSSSSSASSSSEDEALLSAPKSLKKQNQKLKASSLTSASDSDSSSSASEAGVAVKASVVTEPRERSAGSNSSATLSGDVKQSFSSSSASSTSGTSGLGVDASTASHGKLTSAGKAGRTSKGARPTPLAAAAAAQSVDESGGNHLSNAYVPYDYANRAYNDLSVTRGKNFTKEKNKKKRGSYRGGTIDIGSGKGFKFTD
ncbi:MAG: hypothetical protein Q9160_004881 [Pyrenula sp. 1 TL-2023]